MKVFFFDFTINFGGAPQGSLYLMARLKDEGLETGIIDVYGHSKQYRERALNYNLDYYVLYPHARNVSIGHNNNPLFRILAILKQSNDLIFIFKALYKLIKLERPDVLIVNNEKSLFFVKFLKRFFKFKIILYFRSEGIASQLRLNYVKSLINDVDHVVSHSQTAITNLKKAGLSDEYLTYVPNCIEKERFKKPVLSNDLPVKDKFRLILAAARPVREKGHHTAIEALNELKKKNIEVDLLIPGVIPTGVDNNYYEYLISLIKKYNLEENVHFIGWRENLISDIVQCDVVLLPSHTEGFPRSVIESMLHKIPVCATPVGGIPEAIKHLETGMLFEVENYDQLVDNLIALIVDNNLRNKIISNAHIYSHINFNPIFNTQGVISVINKL